MRLSTKKTTSGPRTGARGRNTAASATLYEMDPAALVEVLRSLRESAQDLLAIYHSHPSGPGGPSTRDIRRAFYPAAAHIIVSLEQADRPTARAFRIIDGEAIEIELHAIV